jgi:elongation factor Ts
VANTQSLTLNAGSTGVVSVTGAVGQTTALHTLTLSHSHGATFSSPVIADAAVVLSNTAVGETIRFEAAPGNVLDFYNHIQGGRGVNGVIVEMSGATQEVAHDVAVHIAFARPRYLRREDVPADVVEKERATLETVTRNEGKPEQAIAKVVEGRITGFFKDICLLEQPYAKDDKLSIAQFIGAAQIVRFAQVEIG